mmetsp:Transcript_1815/g.6864  ORF Transcript_1815/g.6864 Transcript_1815/m.6864 type:complete len:237 (+) Transcript_1815:1805-2515(+)
MAWTRGEAITDRWGDVSVGFAVSAATRAKKSAATRTSEVPAASWVFAPAPTLVLPSVAINVDASEAQTVPNTLSPLNAFGTPTASSVSTWNAAVRIFKELFTPNSLSFFETESVLHLAAARPMSRETDDTSDCRAAGACLFADEARRIVSRAPKTSSLHCSSRSRNPRFSNFLTIATNCGSNERGAFVATAANTRAAPLRTFQLWSSSPSSEYSLASYSLPYSLPFFSSSSSIAEL